MSTDVMQSTSERLQGEALTLGNWLWPPVNRQAVRRVREVLPVAEIENDARSVRRLHADPVDPSHLEFRGQDGTLWTVERFLAETYTDGLLILRDGRIAFEWYTPGQSPSDVHIVFSVTKSIIGSLAGVLVADGLLDPSAPIVAYIPEMRGSGFERASVRDLLDMTVSLDFQEAYLDPDSLFARYREATGWHPAAAHRPAVGMHAFLREMAASHRPHGTRFDYLSPNSDLLGWVLERAAGDPLPKLLSERVWKPIGAESSASITLDRFGAPRAAGGMSCTLRDMARIGECMRNDGIAGERQVIPRDWVHDIRSNGDRRAWQVGSSADWVPGGSYRSQWWITNDEQGAYFAAGIYAQWLYVSPATGVVIARQASPPVGPADQARFRFDLGTFGTWARSVARPRDAQR